ncbi:MAG: ABC transporter ATP-binding protein [Pirellulales bacterium]|nr:ABC transporter ATP-binding protein [Pirellulales bacterium]
MTAAIRTEHLTKIYGNRLIAVNDMNLTVPEGAIFGLLGPNGAGKTTTLRLLLGLQRPTAGRAEVFGRPSGPNAVAVRRLIGYLPTHPNLPGNLRPVEYLDLLGKLCRLPREERKPRIASLLRAVGLLGLTDQRIENLSTGETTRLGIAASLVADPPLLIWDEPTAGLDPAARRFTLDLIREMGKSRTVVVATHILGDIDHICDHVGVVHEGQMIFCGPVRDMKRRLRRDDFSLELEGNGDDLRRLADQAGQVEGIAVRIQDERTLTVEVCDGRPRASALAELLQLVEPNHLTLQAVHSGQNETENAYLQLLQEDEAHGFQRFDFQTQRKVVAAEGNPPA